MNANVIRWVAVAAAAALTAPWGAAPARADDGATTVIVAAATAGATAVATLLVKDYFDRKKEAERLERETADIMEEVKRTETRAENLEAENAEMAAKIEAAEGVAEFWSVLIREDEEFFKPGRINERVVEYERGLERLLVKNPALVEKIHGAMSQPDGDWARAVLIRAYGAGTPGSDFWELKKRTEQGLEGGVVLVAGERQPRYVSGAENIMAILDYVWDVAGPEGYRETLQKLLACTPEEVDFLLDVFPERD
jgi:seryl-tRNA synthetase